MSVCRYIFMSGLVWACAQATPAHAWRLESGQVTTTPTTATNSSYTTVTFQETFDVIPIVVGFATSEGADPALLRIRDVSLTGFEVATLESEGSDGFHPGMTFDYVAIEPGSHTLPNGTEIVAGIHSTTRQIGRGVGLTSFDTVSLGQTLTATANVVAALQTMNSEPMDLANTVSSPFMAVAMQNATASTVQMAIERAETSTGTVVQEDIGWIAFPAGTSGDFIDSLNTSISWDARTTADTIVGVGNGTCNVYSFAAVSWPTARVIGSQSRRDGGDGAWLRRCSLSATAVGLWVDEDTTNDAERAHTTETAALLSFSRSFHSSFEGKLDANKTVSTAPGEYALPGSTVSYTIAAQSLGTIPIDADAVVLVDALPPEIALQLADLNGPNSGPVFFDDGSPASGLTYTFLGFASTSDDLSFSNDGGLSFVYTPIDNGSGVDPDVTHIRINPKGSFLERSLSGNPSFEINFDAIIK